MEEEEAKSIQNNDEQKSKEEFMSRFNKTAEPSKRKLSDDGWAGHGGYMKIKNQKLEEQCKMEKQSDIFRGVSIWVNGYTNPSSDELKKLMCEHGGKYQHFFSKTHVTHIIATNLPDSKIKNLKNNDKVVHPNWIVDSVKNIKLLSEDKYLLYSAAKRDGNIIDFRSKETNSDVLNDNPLHQENVSIVVDSSGGGGNDDEDEESRESCLVESQNLLDSGEDNVLRSGLDSDSGVPILSKHSYSEPNTSTSILKAGDKNYIEEFYAHSRLHHLSMWKAELKKFTASIQEKWKSKSTNKQSEKNTEKLIMHIDLDSFFASVALKMNPELKGKPIAVCHSGRNTSSGYDSWSEIASCSYEARSYGLHNGMLLKDARILCPQLVCVPYHFDKYREISQKFYEIISKYTCQVEAVSCDEVLVDITELVGPGDDVLELADTIRSEVFAATQCTVSCGIGSSILIAKLATRSAKPDGRCYIPQEEISSFILSQRVEHLPGIGYSLGQKLDVLNIKTCADLQKWTLSSLQKEFGQKFGETLYKFARGIDKREIKTVSERKSISAEINYGMRFTKDEDVEQFVKDLSLEVEKRLKENKKKGKHLTLKILSAHKDAPDPSKYMGCGICDSMSKSNPLPFSTDDPKVIGETCVRIMRSLKIAPQDYRGIGIQMSKLSDSSTNDSSNVSSLVQFTKRITAEELFERDKHKLLINDNSIKTVKASPKKCITMDKFLKTTSRRDGENQVKFSSEPFPKLSRVNADSATCSDVSHQNLHDASAETMRGTSTDWDPEVLEELPEYIRNELLQHQTRLLSATTRYSPKKINVETSPSSRNKSIKIKKSPSARKSPSKRKGNQKKPMGKTTFSFHKIEKHMQAQERRNTGPSSTGNNIPTSVIDLETLDELPGHMSEITTEIDVPVASSQLHNVNQALKNSLSVQCNQQHWANVNQILSPSQLDQSVLQALPQDIREDVINDVNKMKSNRSMLKSNISKDELCTVSSYSTVISCTTETTMTLPPITTSARLISRKNNVISESNDVALFPVVETSKTDTTGSCLTDMESLLSTKQSVTQSVTSSGSNVMHYQNSLPNLDQSVLNALPDDIRNEILSDANIIERSTVSSICSSSAAVSNDTESPHSICKSTITNTNSPRARSVNKTKSTNSEVLLSPSQIDMDVLNLLPISIQQEVMTAAKVGKQKKMRLKENELREQQKAEHMETFNNQLTISKNLTVKQNIPMLYGSSSCTEIKKMLRNWVDSYPEPLSEDVSEVIDYFHQLLISFNMETLYSLVLFLRRIVSSHILWYTAFNEVLNSVQGDMKSSYTGMFPISPFAVTE